MVHISTDAVFDGMRGDYSEEDLPTPACVYSHTKLEGEQVVAEANPNAIIARVVFFGWSLVGTRSLAEFFFNNLGQGKRVSGFTNMYFCPLLANQLGKVLIQMLEIGLSGLYLVVGPEPLSKYEFGLRLARRFNLDGSLIDPVLFTQASSSAIRSPNLSLRSEKLTRAIGQLLPSVSTGLDELYTLYQQGYPQKLQQMRTVQSKTR